MAWTLSSNIGDEQWPGYRAGTERLRGREASGASRLLLAAAAIGLARAAIVPWTMTLNGRTLNGPTDEEVVYTSLMLMCVFAICAMWARFSPMLAVVFATGLFVGLGVRDFMTYTNLFDAGIVSKILLTLVLLRGFMNAVMSKTI